MTLAVWLTSREIAELTGKRHSDVMEAIRNMEEAWVKVHQRNFSLTFSITQLPLSRKLGLAHHPCLASSMGLRSTYNPPSGIPPRYFMVGVGSSPCPG
ncbi:MAG: Rha family transcriptional regulator [Tenuifilaceae bacterium]|nr:Rha family transcriptional regulator [Tenuifilaceae bacterium]